MCFTEAEMKLNIAYATKDRKYVSANSYQNLVKSVTLEPTRILRRPCGRNAGNRYYYEAEFVAPEDAEFVDGGKIRENINRWLNPQFKPQKLVWDGDVSFT
jgi:hypothetical protein